MNASQKQALIAATTRHVEIDMLMRGTYGKGEGSDFRGCSAACLAHDLGQHDEDLLHKTVAKHYGYPEWLVRLQDSLFENASTDIHVDLARWIKPRQGDEWLVVMHDIHYRILNEVALPHAGDAADAVRAVMELHKNREPAESDAWPEAKSAAESAESAAWSSASSASAAWSAAWSAASAASAAWAAWAESAESAAESAESAKSAAESAASAASAAEAAESARWAGARAARSEAWTTIKQIVLEEIA